MLRKFKQRGAVAALGVLWAVLVVAEPMQENTTALEAVSDPLVKLWQAAWQRQPEAASEAAWQQATQARRETADSWTAGPMALELSAKTDQVHKREGAREYEAGIAVPLWLPGERAASARWAEAENEALASRIQAAKLRTAGLVRQAWWDWRRSHAELAAAQDQLRGATALAKDAARRLRAGDLAQADRNQADGAVAQARSVVAQAQAQEEKQRATLHALTGIEPMAEPTLLATPELVPVAMDTEFALQPDVVLNSHPELLELQHKAMAARRDAERVATQKRDNPEVTLSTARERDVRGEAFGQTVTLGVRIPFGAGSRHVEQWSSANAVAIEANAALAAQRLRVLADIRIAQAQERAAQTRLQASLERKSLAQKTREFYQKSFALGETGMPTRLRIEQEAVDAERQALLAKVEYATAVSLLLQALGQLPQQAYGAHPVQNQR